MSFLIVCPAGIGKRTLMDYAVTLYVRYLNEPLRTTSGEGPNPELGLGVRIQHTGSCLHPCPCPCPCPPMLQILAGASPLTQGSVEAGSSLYMPVWLPALAHLSLGVAQTSITFVTLPSQCKWHALGWCYSWIVPSDPLNFILKNYKGNHFLKRTISDSILSVDWNN